MTLTTKFPTKKALEISGAVDSYGLHRFNGLTREKLQELVDIGAADPEETQNASPSIGEFLEWAGDVTFDGYIITPPRTDARVSVEAITITVDTAEEALDAMDSVAGADELDHGKDGDRYYVHAWWD